ncbi:MAG: cupredoxin domain-containing protein [Pseudonocardiaceae bacterium]
MRPAAPRAASRVLAVSAAIFAILLVAVGCGGSTSTSTGTGGGTPAATTGAAPGASTGATAVVIKDFTFGPANITVAPGTKISVMNSDGVTHTLTADDKSFDTGSISGGQAKELTAPTTPGKYPFHCTPHPFMTGTITVT